MSAEILIVDNDAAVRRLLTRTLDRSGYRSEEAWDADSALKKVTSDQPHLVLLDLDLPDQDGLEILPLLLRSRDVGVVILTARKTTEDKVAAFDLGADDYMTKPFDTEELLARIRLVLRRRLCLSITCTSVSFGDTIIDLVNRDVTFAGNKVMLTPKEYALLAELARCSRRVVTQADLLHTVWGSADNDNVEYLRITMQSLRRKFEPNPAAPLFLLASSTVGYMLNSSD